MTLNEKMAQILAIAEDDRRQESVERAEKNKPKIVGKLMKQAKRGAMEGVLLVDSDSIYINHLAHYFKQEGFAVEKVEQNGATAHLVTVSR